MQRNFRGTHWGKFDIGENSVNFIQREKSILSFPMNKIQNSMINKQDITMELNTDDL